MSDELAKMKPSIGKRVYMVMLEKMVVAPAIVREKVTRETLNGIETSYILDLGVSGKERVPSTAIHNTVVVDSPEAAYAKLERYINERANAWRNEQLTAARGSVHSAMQNANKRFGPEPVQHSPEELDVDDLPMEEEVEMDASIMQDMVNHALQQHATELQEASQLDAFDDSAHKPTAQKKTKKPQKSNEKPQASV